MVLRICQFIRNILLTGNTIGPPLVAQNDEEDLEIMTASGYSIASDILSIIKIRRIIAFTKIKTIVHNSVLFFNREDLCY